MKIIGIQNVKGGVGKTMLAKLVGLTKLSEGKKVLFVDLDSNDDIACRFGFETHTSKLDIINYWRNECSFSDLIKVDQMTKAHIIPATKRISSWALAAQEIAMADYDSLLRETLLDNALKNGYDYVVIDTKPDLEMNYMMALINTLDIVLVPIQEDVSVMDKSIKTLDWISSVNKRRSIPAQVFIVPFNINIHTFGTAEKINHIKECFNSYGNVTIPIRKAQKLAGDDRDHENDDVIDPRLSNNRAVKEALLETKMICSLF